MLALYIFRIECDLETKVELILRLCEKIGVCVFSRGKELPFRSGKFRCTFLTGHKSEIRDAKK